MFNESDEAGIGIMVRDSMGLVIAAMAEKIHKPHSVESLEMIAARRAVIFASELGLQLCKFEGDSETVIKALQGRDMFYSSFGHLTKDTLILVNSLRSSSFSYIVKGNDVVHVLAQKAKISFPFLVWMESVPSDVDAYVSTYSSFLIIFSGLVLFLKIIIIIIIIITSCSNNKKQLLLNGHSNISYLTICIKIMGLCFLLFCLFY